VFLVRYELNFYILCDMNLVLRGLRHAVYEVLMDFFFSREGLWLLTVEIKYLFRHNYITMFHQLYVFYNGRSK
jgi:hypothetical protein